MNKQSAFHFESCMLQPHVVRCIKRVACGSLFVACGMLRSCASLGVNTCFLYVHTLTTAVSAPTRSLGRSMPHHLHPVSYRGQARDACGGEGVEAAQLLF
jgi:hypothetical protein